MQRSELKTNIHTFKREIREDAKTKKNIEENKMRFPRQLRTQRRNKNAIEILKDKLRKPTRIWSRRQEFRNERKNKKIKK